MSPAALRNIGSPAPIPVIFSWLEFEGTSLKEEDDEDMMESGHDIIEAFHVPMRLVPYSDR
jgi:hypothetical protein